MHKSTEITYSHEWIYNLENKLHWKLYWHQLNLVLNIADVNPEKKIVEIGVGSGLVSNYLSRKGYEITTVDIDENKNPDIVANVIDDNIPHADVYLAFEIFEHVPFDALIKILDKLQKLSVNKIIFSIPHAFKTYFFGQFWLPYLGDKTIHIGRRRNHINTKNHHWEIGIDGITSKLIDDTFEENGYKIDYSYRYRNHQFYIANLISD